MNKIENLNTSSFCAYEGSSMNPTLRDLDLLEMVPYDKRAIRVGDVIFLRPPEGDQPIVHRVVRVTPEGIRTRGDNRTGDDPWFLLPADITGQVVAAWRGQKRRKVAGGRAGRLVAHLTRWQRALERRLSPLLRPIYRFLTRGGIVRRLLPSRFNPRVVIFQANGRGHLWLLLGGRVVGRYDAQQRQWQIQRLFRLFVDESALPGARETGTTR